MKSNTKLPRKKPCAANSNTVGQNAVENYSII